MAKAKRQRRVRRPRNVERTVHLRVPADWLERIEQLKPQLVHAPNLEALAPLTRADVLRLALLKGLEQLEDRYAPGWTLTLDDSPHTTANPVVVNPFEALDAEPVPIEPLEPDPPLASREMGEGQDATWK